MKKIANTSGESCLRGIVRDDGVVSQIGVAGGIAYFTSCKGVYAHSR